MTQLNENQQKAVKTTGKNIIVSASAGTGKTTVLINRLIKMMVDDHISIDRVLVMSFTKAAAQEIKDRLAVQLELKAKESDDSEFLFEQIAKLPTASISTIDAFCLDVVKKYGYVLGIDPLSLGNVMSDSDTLLFKQKAMEMTLSDLSEYVDLLRVTCPRIEDNSPLEKAITNISNMFDGLSDIDYFKLKVQSIYADFANNIIPETIKPALNEMLKAHTGNARQQLSILYSEYDRIAAYTSADYRNALEKIEQIITDTEQAIENEHYEDAALQAGAKFKLPSIRGLDDAEKKNIKNARTKLADALKAVGAFSIPRLCHVNQQVWPYVSQIIELTEKYRQNLRDIKLANQTIDFVDMEEMAIRILKKDNGNVARIYRSLFKEIMVDEYQDSSMGQEQLIRLITNGNNVFRVGDVKQSIYGFRNAKPELMISLINNLTDADVRLNLSHNYRSKANIISFTNYIFARLMNVHQQNTFSEDDRLLAGIEEQTRENRSILLQNVYTSDFKGRKLKNRIICNYVADEIRKLHERENIKYSDVAILVRNNASKVLLKDSLSALNIPSFASYSEGFFNDSAVSSVVSLLNLLLDGDNEILLLDVLRGPIFNVTDEQIAQMYIDFPDRTLSEKIARCYPKVQRLINELRKYQRTHTLCELITHIYQYEDWYYYNISVSQRDNLDSLYKDVIDYQQDHSVLSNLVQYLNRQNKADKAEALTVTRYDEVVRIMTIHQSKGLEFKYLFFIDFSSRKSGNREGFFSCDDDLGISCDLITLPYRIRYNNDYQDIIRKKKALDELDEELRLLYVALTRAKDQLTIVYSDEREPDDQPLTLSYLTDYNSTYITWILKALDNCPVEIRQLYRQETVKPAGYVVERTADKKVRQLVKYQDVLTATDSSATPSDNEERKLFDLNYNRIAGNQRGTLMHRAIEMLRIRKVTDEEIRSLPLPLQKRDIALIRGFYDDQLTRQLFENENHNEWPFMYMLNDRFHNGIIDLLSIGKDTVYLIDFKTDRNVDEMILHDRYHDQLKAYHDVVTDKYPDRKIETLIYSFHLGKYVSIKV